MIQVSRTSRYFSRRFEEIYELLKPFSYPLIRFSAGAMMIPHGYGKVFGGIDGTAGFFKSVGIEPALYFAWYVGLAEFVGGICVALGLLTRVFSIQLVIILSVATFYIHLPNGFLWIKGGYEYPLLWMLIMIAITFRGGGAFSLDSQLPKEF